MDHDSPVVEFLQRLIQVRSPPGEEGEIAELVRQEMERLGYHEVHADEAGNVIGRIRGRGNGPTVMLNTHLDHVDAGDPEDWTHPPFAAEIADGRVWGRGAVDIKGPLAAQVHGGARLADGPPPPGDVYVTSVVQEEIGGLGVRHLLTHLGADLVLVGEPSSNEVRRGHRGRAEVLVRVRGRSVHASVPEAGVNPLLTLGAFLVGLPQLSLPEHPELGVSTVAPTRLETDQASANVIPGEAELTCDCRLVPGQSAADVRRELQRLLDRCLAAGADGDVRVPVYPRRSYEGLAMDLPADNPAYLLPEEHPAVQGAVEVLAGPLGGPPPVGLWGFATDGGHFSEAGHTVVGFGPGEEARAHTVEESIAIEELEEAVDAYAALAADWPARVQAIAEGG